MGNIQSPAPVKLFVGLLTSISEMSSRAEERLAGLFGAVDARSEPFPFDLTHYYDASMGVPIYRTFFSFAELIEPSAIAGIKIRTNELEAAFASESVAVQRPINLDPGYIEQSKIVLASTKNFYHRILVSGGIYAEVTLHFEKGAWHPFPWTFPDFKTDRYHPFFLALREMYRKQLYRVRARADAGA
ncbi:MAG: hypothetical protein H6Q07_3398 [Acidobacteria bacterium]|nr:hypothetical protein [Acidobacteriota bacterium]